MLCHSASLHEQCKSGRVAEHSSDLVSVARGLENMGQFSLAELSAGGAMQPATAPATNAWDKPINLNLAPLVALPPKYDKGGAGDQHDSGIDVSEMALNSAASSTRSSPNGGTGGKKPSAGAAAVMAGAAGAAGSGDAMGQFAPKPQRQSSVNKVHLRYVVLVS